MHKLVCYLHYYRMFFGLIKRLNHCRFKFRWNIMPKEHYIYCYHNELKQFQFLILIYILLAFYHIYFLIKMVSISIYNRKDALALWTLFRYIKINKKKTKGKTFTTVFLTTLETKQWPLHILLANSLCTFSAILRQLCNFEETLPYFFFA